mmetsp:Transcript_20808/g.35641  ORF Transcript_20808/g.35641 Transcript_20808/m.35641 type:complete len:293 (-) Transcript_20808:433-1311(-)
MLAAGAARPRAAPADSRSRSTSGAGRGRAAAPVSGVPRTVICVIVRTAAARSEMRRALARDTRDGESIAACAVGTVALVGCPRPQAALSAASAHRISRPRPDRPVPGSAHGAHPRTRPWPARATHCTRHHYAEIRLLYFGRRQPTRLRGLVHDLLSLPHRLLPHARVALAWRRDVVARRSKHGAAPLTALGGEGALDQRLAVAKPSRHVAAARIVEQERREARITQPLQLLVGAVPPARFQRHPICRSAFVVRGRPAADRDHAGARTDGGTLRGSVAGDDQGSHPGRICTRY